VSSVDVCTGTVLAISGLQVTIETAEGVLVLPLAPAARAGAFMIVAEGLRRQVELSVADGRVIAVGAN
jgi:hypothetical protein